MAAPRLVANRVGPAHCRGRRSWCWPALPRCGPIPTATARTWWWPPATSARATELTADDLRLETRLVPTIPDGSQSDVGAVVGSTLAGPARRGEVLTDVRLLGRRLAESAAGPDARIVPVHPADSALIDLVRPGDVVDVVAASENSSQANPHVVATDAIVVSVSAKQKAQTATNDRVVLVALPAASANAVAGAALVQTVTLTLH